MNIDPKDLQEILSMVGEVKEFLPIIKSLIEEMLPDILDVLVPLSREYYTRTARAYRYLYDRFLAEGFTDEQAFLLLLDDQSRRELDIQKLLKSISEDMKKQQEQQKLDIGKLIKTLEEKRFKLF